MRSFDRLFNRAAASQHAPARANNNHEEELFSSELEIKQEKRRRLGTGASEEQHKVAGRRREVKEEEDEEDEEELRQKVAPMTSKDAIRRVLLAEADRDYFRMLELPQPTVDALGKANWDVEPKEVSKAYRKVSILVHPDKNPGEDARKAFEALNKAHRVLKDANRLQELLKEHIERLKEAQERAQSRASLEDRIVFSAQRHAEAQELRKKEAESLQDEVLRQMREKQMRAKRKRELAQQRRARLDIDSDDERTRDDNDNDNERDVVSVWKNKGDGSVRSMSSSYKRDAQNEEEIGDSERRRVALAKRKQQLQKKRSSIL